MAINVKDAQFGAVGDGQADDTAAIQSAITYAKSLSAPGGGTYRATIYFPAGYYYISSPINVTNANGIWLMGDGGRYITTGIIGNTSGAIFDFSGSTASGCENFFFLSSTGYGATRSTIGVQFALTTNGGLNCGIRNCSFQLEDFASANNGFGTIGILNVRSEEFFADSCFIRANTPIVMSNTASLAGTGVNFTATSRYQTLSSGTGTMGVTHMHSASLQNYEKRQPALVLNGTNSFNFQGYIGRITASAGSNETAILCNQYTTNLRIHATIESFSRVIQATNSGFDGNELAIVSANVTAPTTDLINVTGCLVRNLKARISLPVASERSNRYVLYYAPDGGGNQQSAGYIKDSEITCYDLPDNQYIVSGNLLKKAVNVTFNTEVPFEKKGGRIRQLTNNNISAGTNGAVTAATVLRFRQSNRLAFTNSNGGYYRVWVDGVVRAGSYGSGGAATLCFQAQLVINQRYNGVFDLPSVTVIVLDKSVTDPSYLDIIGVLADISFSNGYGTVTVTPRVTGQGTGEPVYYDGVAEIQSDFLVNDPVPVA